MKANFLERYLESFSQIEGWFSFDAALLFMAFNEILEARQPLGHTLEIGVHHGLSSIAIASLRGEGSTFVAVDLFEELQNLNVSKSGEGKLRLFKSNLDRFFSDTRFVRIISAESGGLTPRDLGSGFTFCHIDGGHSRSETCRDLALCHAILDTGGFIALDDYFNPRYPGVCEGAVEFMLRNERALRPLAIAYNKVIFQKTEDASPFMDQFRRRFSSLQLASVAMWGSETVLIDTPIRRILSIADSTPRKLVPRQNLGTSAKLDVRSGPAEAAAGATVHFRISVTNTAHADLPAGSRIFGLSYHVLSISGLLISHDNPRVWLLEPVAPGVSLEIDLPVTAPSEAGDYRLVFDLVWEGVMWFEEAGNRAPTRLLTVSYL